MRRSVWLLPIVILSLVVSSSIALAAGSAAPGAMPGQVTFLDSAGAPASAGSVGAQSCSVTTCLEGNFGVLASAVTDTTAVVSWETNVAATASVLVKGPGLASGGQTFNDSVTTPQQGHVVSITGLTASSTYQYFVTSVGPGSTGNVTFTSSSLSFTTGPALSFTTQPTYLQFTVGGSPAANAVVVYHIHNTTSNTDSQNAAGRTDSNGQITLTSPLRTVDLSAAFTVGTSPNWVGSLDTGTGIGPFSTPDTAGTNPSSPTVVAVTTTTADYQAISTTAGWNLLALTDNTMLPVTFEGFSQIAAASGLNPVAVVGWNGSAYQVHLSGQSDSTATNSINLNAGYFVRTSTAGTFDVTGTAITTSQSVSFGSGWNLIAVPFSSAGSLTLESMAQSIQNGGAGPTVVADVAWNGSAFLVHLTGQSDANATHPVTLGSGYFVRTSSSGNWTP